MGWSDVQLDDTATSPGLTQGMAPLNMHHDPFDPNLIENGPAVAGIQPASFGYTTLNYPNAAYHLYPLIFAGVLGKSNGYDDYGIALGNGMVAGDCNVNNGSAHAPTVDPFNAPYVNQSPTPSVRSPALGAAPLISNHHMEQK